MKFDLIQFINWLSERWHSRYSILLLCAVVLLSSIIYLSGVNFNAITLLKWITIALILLLLYGFWFFTTKVPQRTPGKIGFIVAICTENQKQYKRITEDFIEKLRQDVARGNLKYAFEIIVYPEYYSKKLKDQNTVREYLSKSNAQFCVYGRCRERNISGKQHFVIDLQGAVAHKPLPQDIQNKFSSEFTELLPNRLAITEENDLFEFEIASELVNIVSRYIVGIASFFSGDFEYTRSLFVSLLNELRNIRTDLPNIITIKRRLPQRLSEVLYQIALSYYRLYRNQKKEIYFNNMGNTLIELSKVPYDLYGGHLLYAIYLFLKNNTTKEALKEISQCKSNKMDGTWLYSYAFLKAYDGDLNMAHKRYVSAFRKYPYEDAIPLDCEEFIHEILSRQPDKYQLFYCLGLINYFAKDDYLAALKDFEQFLQLDSTNQYAAQGLLARKYIDEIKTKIKTSEYS